MQQQQYRPARIFFWLALWLLATIWVRPLLPPDEGRYVGIAYDMLRLHDWSTPRLDGLPFFHKPPLFYWITAASLKLFGYHAWAARMASVLGAFAVAAVLFWFMDRWLNRRAAALAVFVLATMPLFFGAAQYASMDALVGALIAVTIMLLATASERMQRGQPAGIVLPLAYVASALGVLTKGLIGLALPGLVMLLWLMLERRWSHLYRLVSLPGIVLFVLIAVPWFALMEVKFPGFLYYTFIYQQFDRYVTTGFNNPQPVYFYPAILFLGLLPWSLLLTYLTVRAKRQGLTGHPLTRLAWVWIGAILLFFSIPNSKLIGYILPVVPAFALLAGHWLERHWEIAKWRRAAWACAWGGAALGIAAVIVTTVEDRKSLVDLSDTVRAQMKPGDEVMFIESYYYSVPFYLHRAQPIRVMGQWNNPQYSAGDSWTTELYTSASFDPVAKREILVTPDRIKHYVCSSIVTWAFMPDWAKSQYPLVAASPEVAHQYGVGVYRLGGQKGPKAAQEVCGDGDRAQHQDQRPGIGQRGVGQEPGV